MSNSNPTSEAGGIGLKAKAAQGIKWQAIEIISRHLFSLILFTVLTRLLAPEDFGLAALVTTFLVLGNLFVDQGLGTALLQRKELEPEHKNVAFWVNLGNAVVFTLLTMLLADYVAEFYDEPRLSSLLRVGILGLTISASSMVHSFLFMREMDFRKPMLRNLLGNIVGGCSGIVIAFAGFGVWSLIWQQLIGAITSSIFVWSASKWRPNFSFSMPHCWQLLHVSSGASLGVILTSLITRVDQLIIGKYLGASVLGEYSVAIKLTELVSMGLQTPIRSVAESGLARMQGDHARMCQAVYKGMEFNALLSFPVFIGLSVVSNELVLALFAKNWVSAGPICALLSMNTLISSLKIFFWPALLASGDVIRSVYIHAVTLLGVTIACFLGVKSGVTYVIAGMILTNLLMSLPCLYLLYKRIGLDPLHYCRFCLMPGISSVVMGAAVLGVGWLIGSSVPVLARLIIKILIGVVSYTGMMTLLAPTSLHGLFELIGHSIGRRTTSSEAPAPLPSES